MPVGDILAADKTAATASNTAADAALSDYAPENVDLTPSDVSAPKGDSGHDDQQRGGTRSSPERTDCGTDREEEAADGGVDGDDIKNEEKKRQREIKRIMRQRRREIEEERTHCGPWRLSDRHCSCKRNPCSHEMLYRNMV